MAMTNYDYVKDLNLAGLKAKVTAAFADGMYPYGFLQYAGGGYIQALSDSGEGSAYDYAYAVNFEALQIRIDEQLALGMYPYGPVLFAGGLIIQPLVNVESAGAGGGGGSVPFKIAGNPRVGQTLELVVNPGWINSGGNWSRNGAPVSGATTDEYVLAEVDEGTMITYVSSNITFYVPPPLLIKPEIVIPVPVNLTVPTITGTAQVGQTLNGSSGTWSNSPTSYAYQWLRGSTPISGATSIDYVAATADIGSTLALRVTASNLGGPSTPAVSANTQVVTAAPVPAPVNTAVPAITGTAQVGSTLTSTNGTWTNNPTSFTRQWLRGGAVISGATGVTYDPVQADVGSTLSVRVIANNGTNSAPATSAPTATVTAAPSLDSRPRYGNGTATEGVTDPQGLFSRMQVMSGGTNGSKVGSFASTANGASEYGWAAFEATASAAGVTFTDALGTGGWQGARSSGNNVGDDGSSPNTSDVTAVINGVTFRFFRQSYAGASGTFTTS